MAWSSRTAGCVAASGKDDDTFELLESLDDVDLDQSIVPGRAL